MYHGMTVERAVSELERTVYRFTLFDDLSLILETVVHATKPSKRHKKWDEKKLYERMFGSSRLQKVEPTLPADVREEAVTKLRERMQFRTWDEYKGKRS